MVVTFGPSGVEVASGPNRAKVTFGPSKVKVTFDSRENCACECNVKRKAIKRSKSVGAH